ncbi:hypothetical protein LK09_17325 [Microbacterium mangrovi]|uniref:Uncharacterized protein n=1 Tax=Microbacterium mangrovi TaxID=1348253 RepID=A0A0B1ZYJ2_9MICO|nr:hypothetical protein LK09_17325 [Microbacterium mangrovi]
MRLTVFGTTKAGATPVGVHETGPVTCDRMTHVETITIRDAARMTVIGTGANSDTSFLVYVVGTRK